VCLSIRAFIRHPVCGISLLKEISHIVVFSDFGDIDELIVFVEQKVENQDQKQVHTELDVCIMFLW